MLQSNSVVVKEVGRGTSNGGGGAIRKGGCIENTNTGLFILADI